MSFNFEDIDAWKKAHAFVLSVYKITKNFPEDERFGLTNQFRRAAVSIEANIAEGYKKLSRADKLRFFNISQGSLEECRDYIILSKDLNYISMNEYESLCQQIKIASILLNAYCKGVANNHAINHAEKEQLCYRQTETKSE